MQELSILNGLRLHRPQQTCSYLPDETESLEFRLYDAMDDHQYADMLRRGWRRHGRSFFRPACPQCWKCLSLRIRPPTFRARKNQRKAIRRNTDVQVVVREPQVTDKHIGVFNRYHADMHHRRGWPLQEINAGSYYQSFLAGDWSFAREIAFHRRHKLIGVGLLDIAGQAGSSVYFYHEPDWRPLGPGTFSMLSEIEHLRSIGCRYHYLGYWIQQCPSMAYKSQFGPHELLVRYVPDEEEPVWARQGTQAAGPPESGEKLRQHDQVHRRLRGVPVWPPENELESDQHVSG